ncbi:hypothetical protein N836_16060 [Leptolyngbya sp. Heron Island J]|nr:hypothetical protein N836_16060 [Leptolyngbya sp. Heron Island J]
MTTTDPPWLSVSGSARTWLVAAAQTWEDTDVSEQYMQQALAQPDIGLDVLVSAYRYYFYKNNNVLALEMALTVCDLIQKNEQWPTDWASLKPLLADQLDHEMVRLYLSAYGAAGLLLARLGDLERAQTIADHVKQIDPKEFAGELLLNILNAPAEDD